MNLMNLKLLNYKNPILRKKSQEVKIITEDIKRLGEKMIEVILKNQGIGLAAPQVGELKRIIAVQTEQGSVVFINPGITKKRKETLTEEEGCLSFPGLFLKIKRAKEVDVEALTLNGEEIKIKADGLTARVFQHEIDHLDGILFIDRISFGQKMKIKLKRFVNNLQSGLPKKN